VQSQVILVSKDNFDNFRYDLPSLTDSILELMSEIVESSIKT